MENKTAIVDPKTMCFCEDGMKPGRIVVLVPDNPDPRLHRYTGNPQSAMRAATAEEIAEHDAMMDTARADAALSEIRVVRALALVVGDLTGKTPAQMLGLVRAKLKAM